MLVLEIPAYEPVLSTYALGKFHRNMLRLDKRDKEADYVMLSMADCVTSVYLSYVSGLLDPSMVKFKTKWGLFAKYGFIHSELSVIRDIYNGITRLETIRSL